MGLFKLKYFALFFDDNGDYVNLKRFKQTDETISFMERKFNIVLDKASKFNRKGLFHDKRYYWYNINNPNPYLFDKKSEPIFSSKLYNIMLETKVARDLNNLANKGLKEYLTPRNIIIFIIILGVAVYFLSGGTIGAITGNNSTAGG